MLGVFAVYPSHDFPQHLKIQNCFKSVKTVKCDSHSDFIFFTLSALAALGVTALFSSVTAYVSSE